MKTYDDLIAEGVDGRTVLVRSDFNVPLDGSRITDDGRIRASLPTLSALRDAGARLVITAHLGRPKGGPDPKYSLAPVAARLGELLGTEVALTNLGEKSDADVVLLENIRFDPRETSKAEDERASLAAELAAYGDAFVSDGFGVVHRKQASVYDVARLLPAYAGGLVLAEVEVLRRLTGTPERPYVVVLGGSKVSDKLAVIEALLPRVDALLVGGGMCFTFLAAQGNGVGKSLLESDQIGTCRTLLESGKIVLPTDVVVADAFAADADRQTVTADAIPDGWLGLDIGPQSVAAFAEVLGAREDDLLERADGRVRDGPVRRGHPRRGAGDHRRPGVLRGRRRRFRGGRAGPRPGRGRVLAHLDRRRGVAGVPGGQGPSGRVDPGVPPCLVRAASR